MKIGVIGALGKMGQRIIHLGIEDPTCEIVFGVVKSKTPPPSSIPYYLFSEALPKVDILIDFSSPEALTSTLKAAVDSKTPLVLGTTGISDSQKEIILQAAKEIPIFFSSNFSLGIALFAYIAKSIAPLISDFSCSMREVHHVHKKDSPSGTAISLKHALSQELPIESLRIAEVIGEHTLYLTSKEENLSISHESLSRDLFAKGALKAAFFLVSKSHGLYGMEDLLLFLPKGRSRLDPFL